MSDQKKNFNDTINLPKTDFPMRAGLPKREPEMLKHWQEIDVYGEMLKKNEGKPLFSLHDGPPFSNGDIHMGHAMNQSLKDFIIRSYAMRGYYTPYIPGWDNHGMPIESAIIKEQRLNHKEMSVADFRSACHDYAEHYIERQKAGFKRLGAIGDWENPYKTMNPGFEADEVRVFGMMYRNGHIYKGLKPVYWCVHDETALAEAEIEYHDDPCTTAYVKFPLHDDLDKLPKFDKPVHFLIWTTTIWTLPGNLGIMVHPQVEYSFVDTGDEIIIVATDLVEHCMELGGVENYTVVHTCVGEEFEYMLAKHPFMDKTSLLMLNDIVTTEDGTGLVHTAPGFGMDDYLCCMKYKTDMIVPVDDQGKHTDYAGKYAGMTTDESNPVILADMKESGMLFATVDVVHAYPHCWRCKNPILFRATPQWFCSVDSFKEEAIAACEDVRWVPAWGKERMGAMIRERADWCISRQRRWGLPIPVFYCEDCGKPVCTEESIEAVAKLFEVEGSNSWFDRDAAAILPEGFTCPHCGGKSFTQETDTLDGWFDSGSTHYCAMQRDQHFWPSTMYIEGGDQYRGWFQSSLLVAVGALGKGAPYKECLTHGWTVAGDGKVMHKSLGNGMDPAEIFDDMGADILRLWAGSANYHDDVRCSKEIFKQVAQSYLKFRNTARYCLGNLAGFNPDTDMVAPADMLELDRWAITKLNALIESCMKAYDEYEFHLISHAINDFCVVELSSFYLDIIKDRLYCESASGLKRRSAQTALFLILDTLAKLFSPILAFTCDEIWLSMPHRAEDDARNVVLNLMNQPFADYALDAETMAKWDRMIALRDDVNVVLERARADKRIGKALEASVTLQFDDSVAETAELAKCMNLAELFIVSKCILGDVPVEEDAVVANGATYPGVKIAVREAAGTKCPRCWTVTEEADPETGLCPRCASVLAEA